MIASMVFLLLAMVTLNVFNVAFAAQKDPDPFPLTASLLGWNAPANTVCGPASATLPGSCPGASCQTCALQRYNEFGSAIAGVSNAVVIGTKAIGLQATKTSPGKGEVRVYIQNPTNGDWPSSKDILDVPTRMYIWNDPEYANDAGTPTANPPGTYDSYYGAGVAMSADYIAVGAYKACRAYVYYKNKDGFFSEIDLTKVTGQSGTRFGTSVAVNSDTFVVGATTANGNCGQIFLYVLSNTEPPVSGSNPPRQRFDPTIGMYSFNGTNLGPSTCAKVNYGHAISITENYLIVSAPSSTTIADLGKVFVYGRSGGAGSPFNPIPLEILHGEIADGQFGFSLSMIESTKGGFHTMVVGDFNANGQQGLATIISFEPAVSATTPPIKTITIINKLEIGGETTQIQYGWSASVSQDFVVIGGNFNKAWIYGRDESGAWSDKLQAVQVGDGGGFGFAVQNSDDWVVVGAPLLEGQYTAAQPNVAPINAGGAIVYRVYTPTDINTAILAALICTATTVFCALVLAVRYYLSPAGDAPVMDAKSAAKAARLGFNHHNVRHKHHRRKGEDSKEKQYLTPQGKNPLRPSGAHLLVKGPAAAKGSANPMSKQLVREDPVDML